MKDIKKSIINKIKEKEDREKKNKTYSEVIRETIKEAQTKPTPTQIVLGSEHIYVITTCIIHAYFVNLGKPGTYAAEVNRMLKANGLPTVNTSSDVPSEELFGAKRAGAIGGATSQESMRSVASGFQEENYDDMMDLTQRDPRKLQQTPMKSIYALTARERKFTEGRSLSLEDVTVREESGAFRRRG